MITANLRGTPPTPRKDTAMIGNGYWATGILVENLGSETNERWAASVAFFDDGFCETGATEGDVRTRYTLPHLTDAIDLVKNDAERLGITWKFPVLYVRGDGEDPSVVLAPDWRTRLAAECERLGWKCPYTLQVASAR